MRGACLPTTLGNMRALGVQRLLASCLNDACRHTALLDVSSYPAETEVLLFRPHLVAPSAAAGEDRRAPKLERAVAEREPDRETVAVKHSLVGD